VPRWFGGPLGQRGFPVPNNTLAAIVDLQPEPLSRAALGAIVGGSVMVDPSHLPQSVILGKLFRLGRIVNSKSLPSIAFDVILFV